ncbi:GNAT family N-acetyltransferase [Microlunatus capsulatus]|uniref:GNAT superfamily N-acetyltransferase n=1 Tax=Microlunatus capsulatus TaxID=99117 RepID=A0ABS4Z8L8_9ACTN|nr:GNAT family N-acetyltransferase [Microlunatus capsulatus]MBP2417314.1 GNAT superfamily N-acetyltransferase [Microlunatus capsulatus]
MARRFRPMTAADLADLPEPCGGCTFWESSLADLATSSDQRRAATKQEWAEAVTRHWGYCGVAAYNDDELIGHLTLAPAGHVPRLGAFATTPVSADAAVVTSVRVAEEHRGHGVGRHLVQTAAALVARRDIRALEAVGTHHAGPSCMLPVSWLESVGFTVVRPHPVTPRLRMDLQTTQRWLPDLGAAWSRLTGLVAAPASVEPATYAHRDAADPLPTTPG